jgi:large subunit ribosomal protein L5
VGKPSTGPREGRFDSGISREKKIPGSQVSLLYSTSIAPFTMSLSPLRSVASSSSSRQVSPRCLTLHALRRTATTHTPVKHFILPEIRLGPTHPSRYHEHYDTTLSSDLMYMSYNHRLARKPPKIPSPQEPMNAYEINRPQPNKAKRLQPRVITPDNIPKLDSIILHTMVKEAIGNKQHLLSAIMALRAISGEAPDGGGRSGSSGVQVVLARQGAAAWRLRSGMPVAVKVEIKGDAMYDYIQSLVDFVLPRIREYPGVPLPLQAKADSTANSLAGIVSFGLPPAAMQLFPQIEANIDAYPRLHGFHMYFKTNQKGDKAEAAARALLSGFRVPFYRR